MRLKQIAAGALAALFLLILFLFGYTTVAHASGNPLPTVFGRGSAVVLSGSMEPEISVGSLLLIHCEKSYAVGEIVTYEDEHGSLVTHQLTSVKNGEAVTKGDANNVEDEPFPESKIYGKVRAALPRVGGMILWLKMPRGLCAVLLVGGILLFVPEFIIRKAGKMHDRT